MSLGVLAISPRPPRQSSGCYETLRMEPQPSAVAVAAVVPSAAHRFSRRFTRSRGGARPGCSFAPIQSAPRFRLSTNDGDRQLVRGPDMTVEIPKAGGRIEAELIPIDDRSLPLSVKLGKSGHVVYALPAMLKMGFRIVECTPAELSIMESRGITLAGSPPLVRWSAG
jgi:hypothetical protein